MSILTISLAGHLLANPFVEDGPNLHMMEAMSLSCSIFVSFTGLVFSDPKTSDTGRLIVAIMLLSALIATIAYLMSSLCQRFPRSWMIYWSIVELCARRPPSRSWRFCSCLEPFSSISKQNSGSKVHIPTKMLLFPLLFQGSIIKWWRWGARLTRLHLLSSQKMNWDREIMKHSIKSGSKCKYTQLAFMVYFVDLISIEECMRIFLKCYYIQLALLNLIWVWRALRKASTFFHHLWAYSESVIHF